MFKLYQSPRNILYIKKKIYQMITLQLVMLSLEDTSTQLLFKIKMSLLGHCYF